MSSRFRNAAVMSIGSLSLLIFSATNIQAGVLAYWRFESGAINVDSAGSNTLTGTGPTSAADVAPSAPGSGSALFDGTQSGFKTLSTLDLTGQTDLTIEWFMKSSQSTLALIAEHGPGVGLAGGFGAAINDSFSSTTSEFEFFQRTTGGFDAYLEGIATPEVSDGEWHHIAVTIDGSETEAARFTLFVDGVLVGNYLPVGSPTGTPVFVNRDFFIGSRTGNLAKYVGNIDELRISGELLTPDKFLNATNPVPEPSSIALLGMGCLGLLGYGRRRRAAAALS